MLKCKAKRKRFSILSGKQALEKEMQELPKIDESFEFISDGTFSSICFILAVASKTKIDKLYASTFRVGKKEILTLKALAEKSLIKDAHFFVWEGMDTDKYPYFEIFQKVCIDKEWTFVGGKNHSKVIMMDTPLGKFVLKTSSNLNENPKMEQFTFEQSPELFDFYKRELFNG